MILTDVSAVDHDARNEDSLWVTKTLACLKCQEISSTRGNHDLSIELDHVF